METRIIYRKMSAVVNASFTDNRLTSIAVTGTDGELVTGDIYVGRIDQIADGIDGAFIDIGRDRNCFLKLTKNMHPIVKQKHADGKLHCGDELLVQIEKSEGKNKPAMVITDISLTGVNVVFFHGSREVRVSSKITDEEWKSAMREEVAQWMDGEYAVMLRTHSAIAAKEEVRREFELLREVYHRLCTEGLTRTVGTKLRAGLPSYLCELRDSKSERPDRIIVQDPEIYKELKAFAESYRPDYSECIVCRDDSYPLDAEFDMRKHIDDLTAHRVWLKSGSYLIIDPTEAMTVIDVNTGKASNEKTMKKGFLAINIEAAEKIAEQMRLRNLSGIIIVDFINLDSEEERKQLLAAFREAVADDPIPVKIVDVTKLGLVEITRMKRHRPLFEDLKRYGLI